MKAGDAFPGARLLWFCFSKRRGRWDGRNTFVTYGFAEPSSSAGGRPLEHEVSVRWGGGGCSLVPFPCFLKGCQRRAMRVLCVESSPETPLRGCCRGPGTVLSNSRPIPGLSRQRCVLGTGSRSFFYILSFFFPKKLFTYCCYYDY